MIFRFVENTTKAVLTFSVRIPYGMTRLCRLELIKKYCEVGVILDLYDYSIPQISKLSQILIFPPKKRNNTTPLMSRL